MESWHQCEATGKRGWKSKRAARLATRKAGRLRVYICKACGRYHVTKQTEAK